MSVCEMIFTPKYKTTPHSPSTINAKMIIMSPLKIHKMWGL
ncbi:Hypothetical protein BN2458_PEG1789 [Helicobacter typhlonius]|uniref:Uncharacterized protein n=1 Tax=Helicobacter typhlonius TaxID=76936 RepID=A0A0S4PZ69_9HELI|nr:Hypothetical protein BN2458_PEG1789 [Helicobacter typhlonius]